MTQKMTTALCAALMLSVAGCTGGTNTPMGDLGSGRDLRMRPADMTDLTAIDPLAGNPQVVKLTTSMAFGYTQSPLWMASTGTLLFSDTVNSVIYQLTPPSTFTSYRPNSGGTNGLALDPQGNLVVCESANQKVSRRDQGANYATVASAYMGTPLNGPNDVTVRSDGTIYFTDPQAKPGQVDALYRIAPGSSTLTSIDQTMKFPDGLALAPDEKTLYVAAATDGKVYKFPVNTDGSLGTRSDFAQGLINCDGLAVDDAGNVYVATPAGVRVFKVDGTARGSLAVPEPASNVGFGGSDRKTLYITASTSIYTVQLQVPGRP